MRERQELSLNRPNRRLTNPDLRLKSPDRKGGGFDQ